MLITGIFVTVIKCSAFVAITVEHFAYIFSCDDVILVYEIIGQGEDISSVIHPPVSEGWVFNFLLGST
jgi:hypothetical protein